MHSFYVFLPGDLGSTGLLGNSQYMPDVATFRKTTPWGEQGVPQMVCPVDWGASAQGGGKFYGGGNMFP